jgi:hypothetical protein
MSIVLQTNARYHVHGIIIMKLFVLFTGTLCHSPQNVCKKVVAVACLHNFCIDNNLTVEHGQEQAGNNAVKQAQLHDDPASVNGSNPAAHDDDD